MRRGRTFFPLKVVVIFTGLRWPPASVRSATTPRAVATAPLPEGAENAELPASADETAITHASDMVVRNLRRRDMTGSFRSLTAVARSSVGAVADVWKSRCRHAYLAVVELAILGPLEVRADGRTLTLGGPKQRALLAILLLDRN